MVRILQKKFVTAAMAAVSVLLLVLVAAMNIANCWISSSQTQQQMNMLTDIEQQVMRQGNFSTESGHFPERFFHVPPDKKSTKGNWLNPPVDEDMAMSLRFFTVCLNAQNEVIRKDISRIASVSDKEAEEYAEQVIRSEKLTGYLEHFKYQIVTAEMENLSEKLEKTVLFLDISRQFHSIWMVFVLSISIALICWLCMFLFVVVLSGKAIRPVADSIQKQRQFVTDAGHEIKTPLAIIQANLDAMELLEGENKWSRNIRRQTFRLNGLMQNLLTLAKMEEESLCLPMETVFLKELLEEAVRIFAEAAALKKIHLEKEVCSEGMIHANREYTQRLLSILLDNAVKYTDEEGMITISLQEKGNAAVLQVKNTCKELPPVDAEKLFDRFYRADQARTQKSGGYGIGLSAAYAIVKAQRGNIFADYPDGHTIRFTVVFNV